KVRMQGLAHVKHESITDWNSGDEYSVKSDTLDNIVMGEKIAGIKMDIENYEFFALKGAERILTEDRPVIYLELWENENRAKCFQFLADKGYKAYVTLNGQLIPYDPVVHKKQNFIFKHQDRLA